MKSFSKLLMILIISVLSLSLFPIQKTYGAADGFPVAPPASTLNASDYFTKSQADPKNFPNVSAFSKAYPQALIVTGSRETKSWQIGGMWSKSKIDLNSALTYDTYHYFGSHPGVDADGMAFVLQNDPLTIGTYGSPGGGLGAYPWSTDGKNNMIKQYIRNALAVEMDNWWNGSGVADDRFDVNYPNTFGVGHLGVVRPGETPLTTKKSEDVGHLQYIQLNKPLSEGKFRHFVVKWTPSVTYQNGVRILGGDLQYYLDDDPTQGSTFHIKNVLDYFKSDKVYYGYTGASGANPTFQAVALIKTPQNAKPVTVKFTDSAGQQIADPVTIPGDPGNSWDASSRRPEWIQYQNNWYQYASKYTADTPDGKDSGQFSATTSYTVTYQYQLRQPPEDFVLQKAVRNDTAGETEVKTETNGQNGDGVTYQLQYTNLTGMGTGSIKDQLDPNTTYTDGSLQIADADTNNEFVTIDDTSFKTNGTIAFPYTIPNGQGFRVRFKAKIDRKDTAETILNKASVGTLFSNQTTIHLPATTGKVIFRYVDRASDMAKPTEIAPEVTVSGDVGKHVSEINADPIRPKAIDGYTVVDQATSSDLTNATFDQASVVDPVISKDDLVVTYRYEKQMLKLTVDPTLDFGQFDNKSVDRTYYIGENQSTTKQPLPFGVTVEDYYGTKGWQLSVQQDGQFKSTPKPNSQDPNLQVAQTLTDATLHLMNPKLKRTDATSNPTWAQEDTMDYQAPDDFSLNPTATSPTVLAQVKKSGHYRNDASTDKDPTGTLYDNSGYGTWRINFGDNDSGATSVGLHVPASTPRYQTRYHTTLTWNLSLLP